MSAKHFVNDPARLVLDALRALTITNPSVTLDEEHKVVWYLAPSGSDETVHIISGGGSGHEPSSSAYVGRGLLSSAVSGSIFASPSASQVLYAIEQADSTKGVLVTVMNYTGDVLNFGVAVEMAKARRPDAKIEMLVVGDDVGVPRSQSGKVGRRGIAGTCIVHKITGAAAARGMDLAQVLQLGRQVCDNLATVGVSLDRVHVPGRKISDELTLPVDEVELGMGIHNEPGSGRRKGKGATLGPLVKEMLSQLTSQDDPERGFVKTTSDSAVLLVNSLGGLSPLEVGAVTTEVVRQLTGDHHMNLPRVYSGTFMTSLNGPGFSISLLFLTPGQSENICSLLDEPTSASGWSGPTGQSFWQKRQNPSSTALPGVTRGTSSEAAQERSQLVCDTDAMIRRLQAGLSAVIESEPNITKYDTIVGDGDCGTTLKRGAEAILHVSRTKHASDVRTLLTCIAAEVGRSMDGTSGALYSIALNALAAYFGRRAQESVVVDREFWVAALSHSVDSLCRYTAARVGDRTMMDALIPFQDALKEGKTLTQAAEAASSGADTTRNLVAKLGRTVYVGGQDEWLGKTPDPGAYGLARFLEGLAQPT